MAEGSVHVVGAGLAGLSAALRLAGHGARVIIHEANPFAGGRCRSFHDPRLGCVIDNGNHLILSGNRSARAYLEAIGAADRMIALAPEFPFVDLADGSRWTLRLGAGRLPWWLASARRRVPQTRPGDYLCAWRLARAGNRSTVAEAISGRGPAWRRFWEPLTVAALNAPPERAAAGLLWAVIRETFLRGGGACRPMIAPRGLGAALVEPAVARLGALGAEFRFGRVLRTVLTDGGRARALVFNDGCEELGAGDRVVLALPPWRLAPVIHEALPALALPTRSGMIVNLFFRLAEPPPGLPAILGVLSGTSQWIFVRGDVVSVTVSAAEASEAAAMPADRLVSRVWEEVRRALGLPRDSAYQAARVNREKRATFDQSPAAVALRPAPRTGLANLVLAGDATDTGLPATIEGAIRSGERAAALLSGRTGGEQ